MPTPEVAVFIDYQNAHLSAHEQWCSYGEPAHLCLIDPLKLAEVTVSQRPPGGILTAVYVYRGRPDPRKQARHAARSDRQAAAWAKDPRVQVFRRPLAYPRDYGQPGCVELPREKGIDVSLAVDLVRHSMEGKHEVAIVFSRDTDLLPAIELAFDMPRTHVEVATWQGTSRLRMKFRQLYCHQLDEAAFNAARDPRNWDNL